MMNSYFEQSGFYGGHGQTGAEQAYRFPLGLGVNPYGPPATGPVGRQESYDAAAAAAAAASCKLYEQQYKLDCSSAKDVVQSGYGTASIKTDNINSWAAAAAAAAAERVGGLNGNVVSGGGGGRGGYQGTEATVAVSAVTPRATSVTNNNPWSPCSLNTSAVAPVPQQQQVQQQQQQQQQHNGLVGVQQQHAQVQQQSQQQAQQQQHHTSSGQHSSLGQQQSPQSQSGGAHTFYPWMAIAGEFWLFIRDLLFVCPALFIFEGTRVVFLLYNGIENGLVKNIGREIKGFRGGSFYVWWASALLFLLSFFFSISFPQCFYGR